MGGEARTRTRTSMQLAISRKRSALPGHNEIATADRFELLEVSLPAEMDTEACDPPAGFATPG